jgi:hypothetical protein
MEQNDADLLKLRYEIEIMLCMETLHPAIDTLKGKVRPASCVLSLLQLASDFVEANTGKAAADQFAKECAAALMKSAKLPTE